MDCFQPDKNTEMTETIVEAAANYFGIEENKRHSLKLFFEFYAKAKVQESMIKALTKIEE